MTVPRPHDRPISIHALADEGLDTFTMRLPRWPIFGVFRRNPLIRASDRFQALVMALAVMVSLLAVPVAAAVGTAVHDSRRDIYAQQHHTRHLVTATITDTAAQNISRTNNATMAARWSAAGTERTGAVKAQSATEPGDHVAIWVDNNGALTDEPTPTTRAGVDAVTAALFTWAGVTAAAAILLAGTRAVGVRIRAIRWQHAIDTLIGHDGHKPSQP
ncbi:Rv1733c family protein [Mycobacterium sp. URHB0021]